MFFTNKLQFFLVGEYLSEKKYFYIYICTNTNRENIGNCNRELVFICVLINNKFFQSLARKRTSQQKRKVLQYSPTKMDPKKTDCRFVSTFQLIHPYTKNEYNTYYIDKIQRNMYYIRPSPPHFYFHLPT